VEQSVAYQNPAEEPKRFRKATTGLGIQVGCQRKPRSCTARSICAWRWACRGCAHSRGKYRPGLGVFFFDSVLASRSKNRSSLQKLFKIARKLLYR